MFQYVMKINNYRTYIIGNFSTLVCRIEISCEFILFNVDLQAYSCPYPRPAPSVDDISKDVSVFNGKSGVLNDFECN
jgi:hypothetical protein